MKVRSIIAALIAIFGIVAPVLTIAYVWGADAKIALKGSESLSSAAWLAGSLVFSVLSGFIAGALNRKRTQSSLASMLESILELQKVVDRDRVSGNRRQAA